MNGAPFVRAAGPVALTVILSLASPARAYLVAVYGPPDKEIRVEEMRALARAVLDLRADPDDPEKAARAQSDHFTVKVSDTAVLTAEFSVPPNVSAYFFADESLVYADYVMAGESVEYEVEFPEQDTAVGKGALPVRASVKTYVTALRRASTGHGDLRLAYSLSTPGRVQVEAVGLDGRGLGKWSFDEPSAGNFERVFSLNVPAKGPFYVRWTHGDAQTVRKVNSAASE